MTARPIRPARSASRFAQRGAGMLLATVFLLVVVALFGLIALRMASTDVTDSAVQNDSVEALFLAESGLERTAQRLVAGTPCTALLPDAVQFLGRGTFQITRAVPLPSGLCQVRVLGSVGLPGATPAQRLIEADLSLGGCRGFAVGERINSGPPAQRGAVLLCWDGSTWTRAAFAGLPNANLYSVSCPAANDCWAVGAPSGGENILHWDGTAWTRWPISAIPNQNLYGVHCFDANTCWAVGRNRTFLRWNGTTWSTGATAPGFPNAQMNEVFCVGAWDCWAIGSASGGEVIAHWTGGQWTRSGPWNDATTGVPDRDLNGITCVSSTDCWLVGARVPNPPAQRREVIASWNGAQWLSSGPWNTGANSVPDVDLSAVSCVSTDNCWAVGTQSGQENIIHWNGLNWTRTGYPLSNQTLYGIAMVNANDGFVVGQNGRMGRWNGSTWNDQPTIVNRTLRAVAMAPAGGGTVAVQRWREIVQ